MRASAPASHLTWVFISIFCGNVVAYFSGIRVTLFVPRQVTILAAWPALLAWAVIIAGLILGGFSRLEALVLRHPLPMVLLGSVVSLSLWVQMGRRGWCRQFCAWGWCFSLSTQREAYVRLDQRLAGNERIGSAAESFFLGRIRAGTYDPCVQFVWGVLYTTYGHLALLRKFLVLPLVVVIIMAECMGAAAAWVFAYVSFMVVPNQWLAFRSAFLLPAGRRERFVAAVALAATTAGVVALFIIVLAILSVPLAALIPEIEVWDLPFACRRIPLSTVWVPFLIVPLIATPRVLFPKTWFPIDLLIFIVVPVALGIAGIALLRLAPFALMDVIFDAVEAISRVDPATAVVVAIVAVWTLFIMACRRVVRCRSFV